MSKEPSLEELIALATQPKSKNTTESSVGDFFKAFGIEAGTYKIQRKFLYKLYIKWARLPKKFSKFKLECTQCIQELNTDKNVYYLLNKPDSELIKTSLYLMENK